MTFKENIITPVVEKQIIRTYEEYTDFISDAKIWVYSLEEVAIEKTCALKKTWETRLSKQMTSLPEYDKVLREVKRSFRKARLLDGK